MLEHLIETPPLFQQLRLDSFIKKVLCTCTLYTLPPASSLTNQKAQDQVQSKPRLPPLPPVQWR